MGRPRTDYKITNDYDFINGYGCDTDKDTMLDNFVNKRWEEFGRQLLSICTKSAYHPCYKNISSDVRSDMIGDLCNHLWKQKDTYNPELNTSIYAYFRQIAWTRMVEYMKTENKMKWLTANRNERNLSMSEVYIYNDYNTK